MMRCTGVPPRLAEKSAFPKSPSPLSRVFAPVRNWSAVRPNMFVK